ncbi:MAG: NifU family protein [Deltaproteobacteria bacterium]
MKIKNETLYHKVNELLDKLRPHFVIDGGGIDVVELTEENILKLKWTGACIKCERSETTFKYSVREFLLTELPELKDVIEM